MYYYGYFRSTDTTNDEKGQLYKVVIITDFQNNGWQTKGGELKLSSNPFVVNYQGEENNLFKPYKCSTATVSFYLNEINKDLYSVRGNDIYVALYKLKDGVNFIHHDFIANSLNFPATYDYKEYNVEWVGFATPNAYNQSFNSDFDLFELEAQDALSTLQYYNYKPCDENIKVQSLKNIIRNIIVTIGVYNNIYVTDNIRVPITDENYQNILHHLYINEKNFYNEDGEPLKMLEVLRQIMQYLSLTAIPYNDSIYIVDYNAIASNYNEYTHFKYESDSLNLGTHWLYDRDYTNYRDLGVCSKKDIHTISSDDIASSDINYSLGSTFNKVKVIDNYYFTKSNDIFENLLETKEYTRVGLRAFGEIHVANKNFTLITKDGVNEKIYINYYGYDNNINEDLTINTYYYTPYQRFGDNNSPWEYREVTGINENQTWNFDITYQNVGTSIIKYDKKKNTQNDIPTMKNAFLFHHPENDNLIVSSYLPKESTTQQKMIDFTYHNQLLSDNDYILINGDFTFYNNRAILLPFTENITTAEFKAEHCYTWAMLKCNYQYWNGSTWQNSKCCFKLPFNYEGTPNSFGTTFPVKSNTGFDNDLPKFGYGIKAPVEKGTISSDIEFTLFRMWGVDKDKMAGMAVLENFNIEIVSTVSELIHKNNSSNTEYTNIINDSAIEEYPTINTNITTHNGKDKDLSTIYFCDSVHFNTEQKFRLKVLYNIATGIIGSAEELMINNVCRQYATPNIIFDISLHGEYLPYSVLKYHYFNGSIFVVDSMSINYANNINTLRLVEKLTSKNVGNFEIKSKKRDYQRNGDIINDSKPIKKDNKTIKHTLVTGKSPQYKLNYTLKLTNLGDIDLSQTDLDYNNIYGYTYMWFCINEDGELIMYRPNIQSNLSARINNNCELEIITNDSIIII